MSNNCKGAKYNIHLYCRHSVDDSDYYNNIFVDTLVVTIHTTATRTV